VRREKFIEPEWVSRRFAKIPHPGIYRPIPVLPTGTGKMLIGAEIIRRAAETASNGAVSPALFIAHREELLHQAQRTLGIITGAERPIEPAFNLSEI
jgi:superfamily II DNA or RNA helicase